MGYRSSVAYWFKGKEAKAVLMAHMLEHPNQECFDELVITDDGVYFEADGVKWYEDYNDVTWHNHLYAAAEAAACEEGSELCGQFVRLGEETDDINEDACGDPYGEAEYINVYVSREYNFPTAAPVTTK